MTLSDILFDLAGTLTDPEDGITRCIQFSLDQLGVTPPREDRLTWCIGPPLGGSFSRLLHLDAENLKSEAALIVGDRSQDIIGGKKNGLVTAAVTYGYGSREEIAAPKPDYVFESPSVLATFL